MQSLTWIYLAVGLSACASSGTAGDGADGTQPFADSGMSGATGTGAPNAGNTGGSTSSSSTSSAANGAEAANDSAMSQSGGPDAGGGLVDQVGMFVTCKPDELNPIVDCITAQCPMQSDPISLVTCLVGDCAALVDAVSPKCRDCVLAGIAQDTAALVQSCLETSAVLGDAGQALPL